VTISGVNVANGLFAVELDFGSAFNGSARWLGIEVQHGSAPFETLAPRQALSPVPYALSVPWSGLAGVPAGFADNVDNNTTYTAQLPVELSNGTFGFSTLGCEPGDIWKYSLTGWSCEPDYSLDFNHSHFGQTWTGTTPAWGLTITNLGTGLGIGGSSTVGPGVEGTSTGGPGVRGTSGSNSGVSGVSTSSNGISGASTSGTGARGSSTSGTGVAGISSVSNGVSGVSTSGVGVRGVSASNYGVFGQTTSNIGVVGSSTSNGTGVYGSSVSGWAAQFAGDVQISGGSCYCTLNASDLRLKRDIGTSSYGLAEVMALAPKTYRWNEGNGGDGVHLGFIAQEVREIIPEVVVETKNGMLGMEYIGLIPVLTKAIQEQQAQIEALSAAAQLPVASGQAAATATEPLAPTVTLIRPAVGPSNSVLLFVGTAVLVFGIGLLAVAGAMLRRT
jgi:hypothetical protein